MAEIGKITGVEIKPNKDGTENVRMLQVELSEELDVQSVEQIRLPGEDTAPIVSDKDKDILSQCVVHKINESWKIAYAIKDGIIPDSLAGEKKFYALNADGNIIAYIKLFLDGNIVINSLDSGGAIKSHINLKPDGNVEVNGNADFAVRFNVLETEFNKLRDAWDTFANAYAPGGPGGVGTPPTASASGSNLAGAKVDTVKLPS